MIRAKAARDRALVVVGNVGREDANVGIDLDLRRLGLKCNGVLKDAFTGQTVAETPAFTAVVEARGFRLLVLE